MVHYDVGDEVYHTNNDGDVKVGRIVAAEHYQTVSLYTMEDGSVITDGMISRMVPEEPTWADLTSWLRLDSVRP